MTDLSIVLPCYNEAGNLASLLERYRVLAQTLAFELVLVDNGSTDDTPARLRELLDRPEHAFARTVRVPVNQGYGHGLQAGLATCQSAVLAFSHADLQCAPEDLQTALAVYRNQTSGLWLVKGRRRGRRARPDRMVTWMYNHLAALLLGLHSSVVPPAVLDVNAEPKLFPRALLPALLAGPADFAFDLYVLAAAKAAGYGILEFEVAYIARVWGTSKLAANPWMRLKTALRSFRWMLMWRLRGLAAVSGVALVLAFGIIGSARADDDTDLLHFREPVVVQHGQEVTTAVSIGSYVQVDGTVRENAVSIGGDVRLGPTGVVEGDAVAIGGKVVQAPGSHISGKVTSTGSSLAHLRRALASAIPALLVGLGVLGGAAMILGGAGSMALAIVVLFLFPDQTRFARRQIEMHPWKTFGAGVLALMLSLPILMFLALTVLGIPLAFVIAVILAAALVLGTVSLGQWMGMRLGRQLGRPLGPLAAGLIGLLLLTLLCSLPMVGFLVQMVVVCVALGAVAFSRFKTI